MMKFKLRKIQEDFSLKIGNAHRPTLFPYWRYLEYYKLMNEGKLVKYHYKDNISITLVSVYKSLSKETSFH